MSETIVTDANFDTEILQHQGVTLVDFWAPWCGPCQIMGPIVQELAEEIGEKAKIGKLNVEENPQTAQKYQVVSIPTFIIFKNGEVVDQAIGAQTKEALLQKINSHLS